MTTMKAICFESYAGPSALQLCERPLPQPKEGEVLIQVKASSLNDWDKGLITGTPALMRLSYGLFKPTQFHIPGVDVSGVVAQIGTGVTQWKVGDAVMGDLSLSGFGAFAEYVCAPEQALCKKPDFLTHPQAATLPHAGLLAWQSLLAEGDLKPGSRILINGGGGGMGCLAIQLAKSFGAEVSAVDSAEKLQLLASLGADHVIDYRQQDFTQSGQRYDLIVDVQAHHSFFDYRRSLQENGTYWCIGGPMGRILQIWILGNILPSQGRRKLKILMHKANWGMERLLELVEQRKLQPVIERIYPLDQAPAAMERYASGLVQGKLVLEMNAEG